LTTPEITQRPNPFQAFLLATRPKTLLASTSPVIVGSAVAIRTGHFEPGPALAALLGAVFLQIGANFANDVYDFQKGVDTHLRLGPVRVTQAGLLSARQVLAGMWLFFGLAAAAGVYLTVQAGWPVVAIGLLSILVAILYTGGPFPLGYHGLGELFVFIFFGLVAVCGTYYVQAGIVSPLAVWAAVPMGLLTSGILSVNNLRDLETDRATGKWTLAARFGLAFARRIYLLELGLAFSIPLLMLAARVTDAWILLAWGAAVLAVPLVRTIYTQSGRPLNKALAATGQLELLYGLLFSIGLILGK